jgi:hypothetical protein
MLQVAKHRLFQGSQPGDDYAGVNVLGLNGFFNSGKQRRGGLGPELNHALNRLAADLGNACHRLFLLNCRFTMAVMGSAL